MTRAKVIASLLLAAVLMAVATGCASGNGSSSAAVSSSAAASSEATPTVEADYADILFDTSRVHTIEVTMSEADRAEQLANPTDKTKYTVDIVVDGEKVEGITFNTKGNSSLFFVADSGRDKFSYGINFGKPEDGRSFHGLDKLNLQNHFVDATLMREYLSYWLFREMGIPAPLASYAWVTVNGEDQGLYLALEDVDDSFLDRTSLSGGAVYKPEASGMALNDDEMKRLLDGGYAGHEGSGGADLAYKDDNPDSYPDIFDNSQTHEYEGTRERVVEALKALSEQSDLEAHLQTGEIIRYFAIHNYLMNYDSYTGQMLHNYCLYEADGKLAMLPWDYDNAFGTFPADAVIGSVVNSNDAINAGIDTPIGAAPNEARPMWNWIPSDENYLEQYHDALDELMGIIESGAFANEANRVYELILPYMEKDPKVIYTPDEFKNAFATMLEVSQLRAESVRKQLNGQLATRTELQSEADKVDASGITMSDMGSTKYLYR